MIEISIDFIKIPIDLLSISEFHQFALKFTLIFDLHYRKSM